jgi:hypothetical protein
MVFISDEGSVFDAPLDKVWKYLSSDQHRHGGMKMINREVNGNVVTLTSERNFMGQTVHTKVRNTLYPPIGFVQEVLEGPLEGSRAFILYLPKGDKTGITVVGEYNVKGLEGDQATRDAVLASSQVSFDEDNANIKNGIV